MKIPAKLKKEIIDGMLVMLRDVYEETESVQVLKGSSLKNFLNVHVDNKGNPIVDSMDYAWPKKVSVKVNHARRIRNIIDLAKTEEDMHNALGDYLALNAKSKEEVLQQIPAHLRKNKK